MNPFSHYDLERPEFTRELEDTINAVEKLGNISPKQDLTKISLHDLVKKINLLELQIKKPLIGKVIRSLMDGK